MSLQQNWLRPVGQLARFGALVLIWLIAFKAADLFGFFKSYSSLWFLPAGVTLAIVVAASGRLKLAPLAANLLLALPVVSDAMAITIGSSLDTVVHALRIYAIYGAAALALSWLVRRQPPRVSLRNTQWGIGLSLLAAALAALSGIALHVAFGNMAWAEAWRIVVPWAIGDAIGAIVVPPLLVPLMVTAFGQGPRSDMEWPTPLALLGQGGTILGVLCIGMLVPRFNADLGSLWYLVIVPQVFFALRGGLPSAATSIFLTSLLAPPMAVLVDYQGERLGLQLLLLLSSAAGLLVGAAVSDRRRAFLELERQQAQLEALVAERTQALEEAYDFQRHLVRSIAHDLRQPVHSMNMMLDGLAVRMVDSASVSAIQHTREMGTAASELISKILNYARLDAGKVAPVISAFSAARVMTALEHIYSPIAHAKGIDLVVLASDEMIVSDEQLVLQVLSNFVDNAVRLSVGGQSVTVSCHQRGDRVTLSVTDQLAKLDNPPPGAAGFGSEIVERISRLLGAEVLVQRNLRGIALQMVPHEAGT
jgi:signal transduction histidine kinase